MTMVTAGIVDSDALTAGEARHAARSWSRAVVAGLLAILLVAFGLRFYQLGDRSLNWDEGHTYRWTVMPPAQMIEETTTKDFNPPAYYFAMHYWVQAFGTSEMVLRLYSSLLSTVTIIVVFLMGRDLFSARVGLVAALLMAVSEVNISYAREARSYSQMVLLATLSVYCCIAFIRSGGLAWAVGYLVASTLLAYTHPYSVFYVAVHNAIFLTVWLMHRGSIGTTLARWIAVQSILLVLMLPFLNFVLNRVDAVGAGFWIEEPGWVEIPIAVMTNGGGAVATAIMGILCVIACLRSLLRPGDAGGRASDGGEESSDLSYVAKILSLGLWFALPIMIPFAMSKVSTPIFSPRYTIGASGALMLLAAVGTMALTRYRYIAAAVLLAVVAHQVSRAVNIYLHPPRWEPWREATGLLDDIAEPGDHLYFFGHFPGAGNDLFRYYSQRNDVSSHPLPTGFSSIQEQEAESLFARMDGHNRVWLVSAHQKDSDGLLEARLKRAYPEITEYPQYAEDGGIRIQLFSKP